MLLSKKSEYRAETRSPDDDEFLHQLDELKDEHRKTLHLYEQLYSEHSWSKDLTRPGPQHQQWDGTVEKLSNMWNDFRVEDYSGLSPREERSLAHREEEHAIGQSADWSHRVTVPQPFRMTVREDSRIKQRSAAKEKLEREIRFREHEEELECEKKFHARPAPAHTFLPLYDEISERQEERRRFLRDISKQVLMSMQKPFDFEKREEEKKKLKRSQSFSEFPDETEQFRARPPPSTTYDDTLVERMHEQELYRQIRMRMRAEEMLRRSKLPGTMEIRHSKRKESTKMSKERQAATQNTRKLAKDVPDFERIHRRLQSAGSKREARTTTCRPFRLQTEMIASTDDRIREDMHRDEHTLKETRWPFKMARTRPQTASPAMAASADFLLPTKSTETARMRDMLARSRLQEEIEKEMEEARRERDKRDKYRKLHSAIVEKADAHDPTRAAKSKVAERMKERKTDDEQKTRDYFRHIDEMKQRVYDQPLLIERMSRDNAAKAAKKRYQQVLRQSGVDQRVLEQHQ